MAGTNSKPVIETELATETSLPKNWSNVRKLKEQRELLHQKLFASSLKLHKSYKNDCNGDTKGNELVNKDVSDGDFFDSDFSDTESCESENLVIDETYTPGSKNSLSEGDHDRHSNNKNKRTKCANNGWHGNGKECEGNRKKRFKQCEVELDYLSEDNDTDSHDCSDLCLLTPAKINNALHVAIASVNSDVGKKHAKEKMKNVLSALKIKSEFNDTTDTSEPASYTISRPYVNLPAVSGDSSENLMNDRTVSMDSDYNNEIATNTKHCSHNDNWKYFGIPYNPHASDQLSHSEDESFDRQLRSCGKQKTNWSRKLPGTPSELGDCGRNTMDRENNIDYTNIAFQKLMAERRLNLKSKSDNDLHGKKTQYSKCKDLKMIRSVSETGTTLVDFQEIHKDQNTNDSKSTLNLYQRVKDVREAEKQKLKLELDVLKLKNRLMDMKYGSGGNKPNCLRSAITVNEVQKTGANVEGAEKTNETGAEKSTTTTKSVAENVMSEVLTKRTDEGEQRHLNSMFVTCTAAANKRINNGSKICNLPTCISTIPDVHNVGVNAAKTDQSKVNESCTRSIMASQSLLKKHLTQKDKFLNPTSIFSDEKSYQVPTSTVSSGSALPSTTYHSVTEFYRVQNINSKKLQSTVANPVPSCITSSNSVSSIHGLTPIISDKCHVDDRVNPTIKQCGTNKLQPMCNGNGSPFVTMNNRLYLIRSSTPGQTSTGGKSMVCGNSKNAPVLNTVIPIYDPNTGTNYINILPPVVSKDSSPSMNHGVRLATSIPSFVQKLPISRCPSGSGGNIGVNYVLVPTCNGSSTQKQMVQGLRDMSSMNKSNIVINANSTTSSGVSQRLPYPVRFQYVGVHDENGRSLRTVLQPANHNLNVTNSTTTIQSKPGSGASVVTTSSVQYTKSKIDNDSLAKPLQVNLSNIQNIENREKFVSENSTSQILGLSTSVASIKKTEHHNFTVPSCSTELSTAESKKLIENEQVMKNRKRKHSKTVRELLDEHSKFDLDDYSKHKRKRKDNHAKKVKEREKVCINDLPETDQVEETKLLNEWMAEQEEIKKRKSVSEDEDQNDEKIETPVPFVNYPARIVSKERAEDGTKIASIVGTPKLGNSSTDTSLNEEKMIKLLTFADEYEMEQKQKDGSTQKRKGRFKRRKRNSRNYSQTSPSDDNLEEISTSRASVTGCESEHDNSIKNKVSDQNDSGLQNEAKSSKDHEGQLDTESIQTDNDRNIFNTFNITDSKETDVSEKLEPNLDDCYDSSDAENYEKFILNKAKNSMKRKSQLIESYYTTGRLQEQNSNMVPCSSQNGATNNYKPYIVDRSTEPECASEMNPNNVCVDIPGNCGMVTLLTKTSPQEFSHVQSTGDMGSASALSQNSSSGYLMNAASGLNTDNRKDVYGLNFNNGTRQVTHTVNSGCLHHHGMFRHTSEALIGPKSLPCYREMFIKTKLIILKGDMCDKWMKIKNQTGFGEMTDPQFLQYLMRLEEERQKRMQLDSPHLIEEPLYFEDSLLSKEFSDALTSTPIVSRSQLVSSFHKSPIVSDIDINNNKSSQSPDIKKEVDLLDDNSNESDQDAYDDDDDDDDDDDTLIDIVNVSTEADHHLSDILPV